MTLAEYEALSDAERDALLAERVMEFRKTLAAWYRGSKRVALHHNWRPTRNDADACAVLDRMVELGWQCVIYDFPPGFNMGWHSANHDVTSGWNVDMHHQSVTRTGRAPTRPAAICLAALRAVGAVE